MRGQVLGVDTRTGDGIVTGEDGRRYSFKPLDWADRGEPAVGMQVDFETHENRALSIFPVPGASPPPAVAHGLRGRAQDTQGLLGIDLKRTMAELGRVSKMSAIGR